MYKVSTKEIVSIKNLLEKKNIHFIILILTVPGFVEKHLKFITSTLSQLLSENSITAPLVLSKCVLSRNNTLAEPISLQEYNWLELSFPSPRPVAIPRLKNLVCPTIYP